jgi:hypothetical protein
MAAIAAHGDTVEEPATIVETIGSLEKVVKAQAEMAKWSTTFNMKKQSTLLVRLLQWLPR